MGRGYIHVFNFKTLLYSVTEFTRKEILRKPEITVKKNSIFIMLLVKNNFHAHLELCNQH